MTIPEKAVEWALSVARDNSHGYDQGNRWGPDYDCSSLVISAYKHAGLPLQSTYTGNMKADFLRNGFTDLTDKVNLATGAGLVPGDVLLNETHHTAMYVGNGQIVEATGNERGGVTGGQTGDQTGREITVNPYRNYGAGWDCVLRYVGEDSNVPTTDVPGTNDGDTYTVKLGDSLWAIAMAHGTTVDELARINGINKNDFIYPGQILKLKDNTTSDDSIDDVWYTVKEGDSICEIAHNTLGKCWRWYKIAEANGLSIPVILTPGQRIKIPRE